MSKAKVWLRAFSFGEPRWDCVHLLTLYQMYPSGLRKNNMFLWKFISLAITSRIPYQTCRESLRFVTPPSSHCTTVLSEYTWAYTFICTILSDTQFNTLSFEIFYSMLCNYKYTLKAKVEKMLILLHDLKIYLVGSWYWASVSVPTQLSSSKTGALIRDGSGSRLWAVQKYIFWHRS